MIIENTRNSRFGKLYYKGLYFGNTFYGHLMESIIFGIPFYLTLLGFYDIYDCKVLGEPIQDGSNWNYNIEVLGRKLYWFGIYIKDLPIKIDESISNTLRQ